jgi:molybdopterin-guanine dinucleotide biosynthesis protein A
VGALIAIMAGGRAARLGGETATVELAGVPLIEWALAAAREAAGTGERRFEVAVVAKRRTPLPPLGCRVIHEPREPSHPLRGIVTALREGGGRPVVVVACDMPFVTGGLLAWLASLPDPLAVPRAAGRLHPLLARYDPSVLEPLEAALGSGRPLQETVASLGPRELGARELGRFGDPERLLLNVNTRADLAAAERLARS